MLDKLLEVVSGMLNDTEDIDCILEDNELDVFRTKEILDKTDQDIKDFLEQKEIDGTKRKLLFEIFQKLKIEQSIDELNDISDNNEKEETKEQIKNLFGKIMEPDEIAFKDEEVILTYKFNNTSCLKNKLLSIEQL